MAAKRESRKTHTQGNLQSQSIKSFCSSVLLCRFAGVQRPVVGHFGQHLGSRRVSRGVGTYCTHGLTTIALLEMAPLAMSTHQNKTAAIFFVTRMNTVENFKNLFIATLFFVTLSLYFHRFFPEHLEKNGARFQL